MKRSDDYESTFGAADRERDRAAVGHRGGQQVPPDLDHEIANFERRDGALKVRAKVYRGAPFVDVRLFFRGSGGELHPTSKGVSLRLGEIEGVIEALRRGSDVLAERGSK